jgi:hypothetical protein
MLLYNFNINMTIILHYFSLYSHLWSRNRNVTQEKPMKSATPINPITPSWVLRHIFHGHDSLVQLCPALQSLSISRVILTPKLKDFQN